MRDARVPMITFDGICHSYIDVDADIAKAIKVCDNAKPSAMRRATPPNLLLVRADIAARVLPELCAIYQKQRALSCVLTASPAPRWKQYEDSKFSAVDSGRRLVNRNTSL